MILKVQFLRILLRSFCCPKTRVAGLCSEIVCIIDNRCVKFIRNTSPNADGVRDADSHKIDHIALHTRQLASIDSKLLHRMTDVGY